MYLMKQNQTDAQKLFSITNVRKTILIYSAVQVVKLTRVRTGLASTRIKRGFF